MKSIRLKLILVLVAVCGIQALLVAGIVRFATLNAFDQFLLEDASDAFVDDVSAFLVARGSFDNMLALFGPGEFPWRQGAGSQDSLRNRPPTRPRARTTDGQLQYRSENWRGFTSDQFRPPGLRNPRRPPEFGVADTNGFVVLPTADFELGLQLTRDDLEHTRRVDPEELQSFYVLPPGGSRVQLGRREQEYIRSADIAIGLAVAVSLAAALLIGFVSVRIYAQPLRDLTRASKDLARGISGHSIPVRTSDEVGQLTEAFNELTASLEESRNARTQMTADVVHDLGTPITVIAGYLQSFQDGDMEATPARMELVLKETMRLSRLVEDLRVISLMDSSKFELDPESVSVVKWTRDLRAAFEPLARASIELELSGISETAWFDERRMTQAVSNLLSNAVRYTDENDTIRILVDVGDSELNIAIEDTGNGISPDDLPYVFDRFFRADPSRNMDSGESGLGLSIVRSIVELHGGKVNVTSIPNVRTCFSIVLPQHAGDISDRGYKLSGT